MRKLVPTLLLFTSACLADGVTNIVFTNLPGTQYPVAGDYNGFTTATVGTTAGGTGGIAGLPLICDDEAHNTLVPSGVLPYDYSTINTSSNTIANARFTPSTTIGTASYGETQTQMYEEAAIIVYNLTRLYASASAETIATYQYALWNLMNSAEGIFGSNDPNKTTDNNLVASIQSTAKTQLSANTTLDHTIISELVIYTPTAADASNQEWLRLVPTPEPSTAGAAGVILFGIGFAAWKRRKVQAAV